MKTLTVLIACLTLSWNLAISQGEGKAAADKIIEQLDRTNTAGDNDKKIVDELKKVAKDAGEANPDDADAVKEAVKKRLKEMRDRTHSSGKPGGKNNETVKKFINDLENVLDNKNLISALPSHPDKLLVLATGTNQTTGTIGNLEVTNLNDFAVSITPQTFFMPSDGRYQSYVGRIPEGITVPPDGTVNIPIDGMCTDVTRPPVPLDQPMPPVDNWIPVEDPIYPPDIVSGAPQVPEPMNPPGASAPPDGMPVKVITTPPVTRFTPDDIPGITTSSGFTPDKGPAPDVIATWPGTDIPVGGTFDPAKDPVTYAPVVIAAWEAIEEAVDVIQASDVINTPFSNNPPRERESIIQQTVWWYTAALNDDDYEQDDFADKVYDQYEDATGRTVSGLPEEQKEQLDEGIADFWNAFQATGVEAKVISADSPGLIDPGAIMATVSTPNCRCRSISYDLEVRRGGIVVHSDRHTTPRSPGVRIPNFRYGDALDVKISGITVDCACAGAPCTFYPAESTNPNSPRYTNTDLTRPGKVDIEMENDAAGEYGAKGNHNCQNRDKTWDATESEYTFRLETRDEGTNNAAVFQRLRIKAYCQLEDCRRTLCAKYIQLNFVTAR